MDKAAIVHGISAMTTHRITCECRESFISRLNACSQRVRNDDMLDWFLRHQDKVKEKK